PAASIRSSGDGDARGRGVERAGRPARLEFREAIHGTRPVVGDRGASRLHHPWRATVHRRLDRAGSRSVVDRSAGPPRMSSAARPTKYVFVTGGVVSALGKGIVAASLGRLLKAHG